MHSDRRAQVVRSLAFFCALLECSFACAEVQFEEAAPVWPKGCEAEVNSFFGFRTKFVFKDGDVSFLRITGCSDYRISVNGRHVGWGPARAAKGWFRVDEIPLNVVPGTNVVAIEVAGYNCESYCHMDQSPFLQAEVIVNGQAAAATGSSHSFEAQRLPRVQKVVRYSGQRTFSEYYYLSPGFDDWKAGKGDFKSLPLAERPRVKLLPRRAPYADFKVNGPFRPLSFSSLRYDAGIKTKSERFIEPSRDGVKRKMFAKEELDVNWYDLVQRYVAASRRQARADDADRAWFPLSGRKSVTFDAGMNDTGFIGIKVKCRKPGKIAVKFDEILVDGEVSPTRYKCANVVAWNFEAPGEYAVESFEPYTLRFAEVLACDGEFVVSAPFLRTYKNPEARRARMWCSDPAVEKVFEAARETYAQNAADVFTDCPGRERAGWLCDSFFTSRASLLFTGNVEPELLFLENYSLPDKFENIPDGMVPMCYPADHLTGRFIPNWAMWLVLEMEEFKKRGGDASFVEKVRPRLTGIVKYLMAFRNSDGLLENLPGWVFIEWSDANKHVQDVNYPSNMLWAETLDAMHRLYGMSGLAEEAQKVREAIRRQAWTGKWFRDNAIRQRDGSLKLGEASTETCQYYAFYFKTATPATHPELWRKLVQDFGPKRDASRTHPEIRPSNAFIGNYLRLECLSRERLFAEELEESRRFFLHMVERTSTLWEHASPAASCNHGFASHVAYMYCRDLLGVKIDYAGKSVLFDPPEDVSIDFIGMDIPVSNGESIFAEWRKVDGRIAKKLRIPSGWREESIHDMAANTAKLELRWEAVKGIIDEKSIVHVLGTSIR